MGPGSLGSAECYILTVIYRTAMASPPMTFPQ